MSQRQDYIAKVRYQNELPPPPCPPKLLTTPITDGDLIDSPKLLTSLFRRENFKNLISDDSLKLDPFKVPGFVSQTDESTMGKLPGFTSQMLHPDDQLLLIDPSMKGSSSSSSGNVSFLRRTQYIAADKGGALGMNNAPVLFADKLKHKEEKTDPESQLRAVEETFENAADTLMDGAEFTNLRHPVKKNLKAKKVFTFLPDTSMMDQIYMNVKFLGSASIVEDKTKTPMDDPRVVTSLFKPMNVKDVEWVSLFQTDSESAQEIKGKVDETTKTLDDSETKQYNFKHARDYNMEYIEYPDIFEELAITLDDKSQTAYFLPISGRVDLKRRRVAPSLEQFINEEDYTNIALSIREPETGESITRDNRRVVYDPMEYAEMDVEELEEQPQPEEPSE